MQGQRTYLDFNATTPMSPAVRARVIECMDRPGNPSSVHGEGRWARAAVEDARAAVAGLIGTSADCVTFTSGATEAISLALAPDLGRDQDGDVAALLVGGTEHPAVMRGHRFPPYRVEIVPVGSDGVIDLDALGAALRRQSGRVVVALQAANGETGVLQPVREAARLIHERGGLLVCDAVQAAGRVECRFESLDADVLVLSSHKLGGPLGVGAVAVRNPSVRIGTPMVVGGGQERGLRGGTENVPGIAGFGAAVRDVYQVDMRRIAELRDGLEQRLLALAPETTIFGRTAARLPNTSAFAIPGLSSESLMMNLDLSGIAVSTGSACSSGKVSRSEVLEAMGVSPHLRQGLIRVSLGWSSTIADTDRFIDVVGGILARIRLRAVQSAA